jgi:hypothetical protein
MKFVVTWNRKKKKATSTQSATFYKIEDAIFWENHLKKDQSATFYKIEDAIFWENHLKKDTAHSSIETKPIFSS